MIKEEIDQAPDQGIDITEEIGQILEIGQAQETEKYYRDRDYRDRDYRGRDYRQDYRPDYRSRTFDRSRNYTQNSNNQRGFWKRQNYSHCAGCGCNNHQHNHQQQGQQGRSDGKHARTSRGNTPCPDNACYDRCVAYSCR